jgi:hypothetical protein
MIVRDGVTIVRERQLAIRREMDRRGIALKQVEFDSGIPYATLLSYFPAEGSREPAVIPASAIYKLAEGKALPNDLLSLLLPQGLVIVQVPEGIDHDELADAFADYLHTKNAAHHPESPAGRDIADCERDTLNAKVVQLPLMGRVG